MKIPALSIIFVLAASLVAPANDPVIWTLGSRADFMKGDARDVSIDESGRLRVNPKAREIFDTAQPIVWSSAVVPGRGFFLGTGGDGKVFRVDEAGKGSLFADLAEMNVSAMATGPAGEIFAAGSPDGKVYRIDGSGNAKVFFDPQEKYIWSLALFPDGSLAVGTGESGKIYRVRAEGAKPENSVLFDSSETHIISLETDRAGNLYAGTDSNGIVLKIGADGKVFALLDSPLREIHDLTVSPDGSVFALALGESVSAKTEQTPATPESKTVTVEKPNPGNPEQPKKSMQDLTGAKSAVHRISPDGSSAVIWNSASAAAFSLALDGSGRVLIGTSDRGRTYSIGTDGGGERVISQLPEEQVSDILLSGSTMALVTSGQGKLFTVDLKGRPESGVYESPVLDAKAAARWGRITADAKGDVRLETRSGNTETPDETWSGWSGAAGGQSASPVSRYFQWRALLKGDAEAGDISVTYRQRNIAPEILSVEVLPTNVGLAPNPGVQIDPNIELSGQDPAVYGIPAVSVPPRRLYQRGARSLQWTAEDRNDDVLVFDVLYKAVGDPKFRVLKAGLTENYLTIDGLSLSDGRYVFAVVAGDAASNPPGEDLSGRRETEPVEIDNSAPTLKVAAAPVTKDGTVTAVFEAVDAGSLMRAEFSVNGRTWRTAQPEDGISDGPAERYIVRFQAAEVGGTVVLRAFDRNGNVATLTAAYGQTGVGR